MPIGIFDHTWMEIEKPGTGLDKSSQYEIKNENQKPRRKRNR